MTAVAIILSALLSAATFKHKPEAVAIAASAVAEIPGAIRDNTAVHAETNRLREEIREDIKQAVAAAKPAVIYNVSYPAASNEYQEPAPTHYRYVDAPSSGYLGD